MKGGDVVGEAAEDGGWVIWRAVMQWPEQQRLEIPIKRYEYCTTGQRCVVVVRASSRASSTSSLVRLTEPLLL